MKKYPITSWRRKLKSYIYSDNIQKSYYLNQSYLAAEYNKDILNSLNSIYQNYKKNYHDHIIENNLRIIGYKRLFDLKKRLKESIQSLKNFDDKYIFNIIQNKNKKNICATNLIINKEENKSLNISNINKKSKPSEINKTTKDKYKKKQKINNIKSYNPKSHSIFLRKKSSNELFLQMNKNFQKLKKMEKLSNLNEKIDTFMKHEINFFKIKKEQKRPKSHYNYRNKIITKSSNRNTSSAFYRTNETTMHKNKNKINNFTSKSNNDNLNYSTSSSQLSTNLKYFIQSPFLLSTENKNKSKYILSKRACETSREIKKIAFKSIIEANKIDYKIKKNFNLSIYKKPKIFKKNKSSNDIFNNKSIDLNKIRKDLKLKNSNGLLGEINEIEILEKDLKKMGKRLNKKEYMDILTPIARGLIRKDLLLNKRLIYNVGIEHYRGRKKYFELYDTLNNLKKRKKLVEDFIIN